MLIIDKFINSKILYYLYQNNGKTRKMKVINIQPHEWYQLPAFTKYENNAVNFMLSEIRERLYQRFIGK